MSIDVTNLWIRYGRVEAVRGISFSVEPGEICAYLGPNGAGKTSTVKALTGLIDPAGGSASVGGFDVVARRQQAQGCLGYVPEGAPAYPLLTGAEFLELVSQLRGMTRDQFETRRQFLVDCFDLGSVSNRPVATFSKGQRQRLVLIAALLHDPDVLILDEPLSGLDANGARTVKDLVQGLAASGKTILFCTHTLEVVERLCSRVIILNFGRVVLDEPIAKVLGRSPDGTLETVFTSLTRTGIGVPVPATEQ